MGVTVTIFLFFDGEFSFVRCYFGLLGFYNICMRFFVFLFCRRWGDVEGSSDCRGLVEGRVRTESCSVFIFIFSFVFRVIWVCLFVSFFLFYYFIVLNFRVVFNDGFFCLWSDYLIIYFFRFFLDGEAAERFRVWRRLFYVGLLIFKFSYVGG